MDVSISPRKEIDHDLFGSARTRSEVFWERYDLLLQVRTLTVITWYAENFLLANLETRRLLSTQSGIGIIEPRTTVPGKRVS